MRQHQGLVFLCGDGLWGNGLAHLPSLKHMPKYAHRTEAMVPESRDALRIQRQTPVGTWLRAVQVMPRDTAVRCPGLGIKSASPLTALNHLCFPHLKIIFPSLSHVRS